ncbi:response regulator transcription factor [Streptomyces nigrescens]|uniref:LuxR C-terminal-related transcriptional regulator n=1 Tax=Streptomyces nigrescens TaxID=1920 RepID=A0ABY7J2A2_STRNI|nr:LuxR C-terminal-related transcriptional regulator [Streptomyces nigrescens]WAU03746.1 LuxR C-terminal-related transcriptional regulator [Streptomyces nigrescens]
MTMPTLPPVSPQPPRVLTPRQEEVLRYMLSGATASQIADALSISRATVQSHLRAIYAAFGVKNRALAVIAAIERGYLPENVDAVWNHDREHVLRALRQAWSPCQVHPVYARGCAVCVRAATLTLAMAIVRNPGAVPNPPPAGPPAGFRRPQPGVPGRGPQTQPGTSSSALGAMSKPQYRAAS